MSELSDFDARTADDLARLNAQKAPLSDHWKRAVDIVLRATAFDTGAIEGLYETDYGFTFAVAVQGVALRNRWMRWIHCTRCTRESRERGLAK